MFLKYNQPKVGQKKGDIINLAVQNLRFKSTLKKDCAAAKILKALRSRQKFFEDEGGLGQQVKFPFFMFCLYNVTIVLVSSVLCQIQVKILTSCLQ